MAKAYDMMQPRTPAEWRESMRGQRRPAGDFAEGISNAAATGVTFAGKLWVEQGGGRYWCINQGTLRFAYLRAPVRCVERQEVRTLFEWAIEANKRAPSVSVASAVDGLTRAVDIGEEYSGSLWEFVE